MMLSETPQLAQSYCNSYCNSTLNSTLNSVISNQSHQLFAALLHALVEVCSYKWTPTLSTKTVFKQEFFSHFSLITLTFTCHLTCRHEILSHYHHLGPAHGGISSSSPGRQCTVRMPQNVWRNDSGLAKVRLGQLLESRLSVWPRNPLFRRPGPLSPVWSRSVERLWQLSGASSGFLWIPYKALLGGVVVNPMTSPSHFKDLHLDIFNR